MNQGTELPLSLKPPYKTYGYLWFDDGIIIANFKNSMQWILSNNIHIGFSKKQLKVYNRESSFIDQSPLVVKEKTFYYYDVICNPMSIIRMLVNQEWSSRKNNHLKRLIKQAKFVEQGAGVEDIEYHPDRNLNQTQIARLSTCNFITERHNVLLLGATGSGKTYIACALGMAARAVFYRYDTSGFRSCSPSLP